MDQFGDRAPEHRLLVEQVRLAFLGEAGGEDADPAAADRPGVGEGQRLRSAARILLHREQGDQTGAGQIVGAERGAGPLGRHQQHVEIGARFDQAEADREAMGELDGRAVLEIRFDFLGIDAAMILVGGKDDDQIDARHRLG